MGRVVGAVDDEVSIEFLIADPGVESIGSRVTRTFKLEDAKALSAGEVQSRVDEYVTKVGPFFDRTAIKRGDEISDESLKKAGFTSKDREEINQVLLDGTLAAKFNKAVESLDAGNQKILSKHVDLRSNITEQLASKIENVDLSLLPDALQKRLGKLSLKDFASYYRATVSTHAINLAEQGKYKLKKINEIIADQQDLAPSDLEIYRLARDIAIRDSKVNPGLVDLWRSFIVSQPATTTRNVLGSADRVPGITARAKVDQLMAKFERQLQGLPDSKEAMDIIKEGNSAEFLTRLLNPTDSIQILEIFATSNKEVRNMLKNTFDDRLPVDPSEASSRILRGGYRVSKFVNTLNRMQDRGIKSSAFIAEMNNQIRMKRARGYLRGTDIKTFEDILATSGDAARSKLKFIDDDMVARSVKAAYEVTYQSKRVGDKLLFGGAGINKLQDFLNDQTLLKLGIPFPNFVFNSFVYTVNRLPFVGVPKLVQSATRLVGRRKLAPKNRKRLDELVKKENNPSRKKPITVDEKREIQELRQFFGKSEYELLRAKDGFMETAAGGALFGVAYWLRSSEFAGERWDQVKTGDGEYFSLSPLFPLAPFLLLADIIKRWTDDVPQKEGVFQDLVAIVTSLDNRGGAVGDVLSDLLKEAEGSEATGYTFSDKFGRSAGVAMGSIFGGFLTPLRAVEDVYKTVAGPERRQQLDSRQQKDFLVDAGVLTKGEMETETDDVFGIPYKRALSSLFDELVKATVRGTPFEKGIGDVVPGLLDESKVKYSSLTSEDAKTATVPALKQVLGTGAQSPTGLVEKEFNRLGLLPWKVTIYSEVPEWRSKINQVLGILSTEIVEPMLGSEIYLSKSDAGKARYLANIYTGPGESVIKYSGENYSNVKSIARAIVKEKFPILTKFHEFKSGITNEYEDRIKTFLVEKDPKYAEKVYNNLQYTGENDDFRLEAAMAIVKKIHTDFKQEDQAAPEVRLRSISTGLGQATGGLMGRP
jgi:hypothetical protein